MFEATVIWKKKTPEDKFEEVSREDYIGGRAAAILINQHGDCALSTFGMPLTEAMGCLGYMLRNPDDFAFPSESNKTLIMELQTEISGPDLMKPKVETHDYYRGILVIMNYGHMLPEVIPLKITEIEGYGVIDIVRELQLINMGMQSAMRGMVARPQPGGIMLPMGGAPKIRF
ncbi:MAG: hypothetical protein WC455_13190 [Dehalococcoidia bacterium]|jgi:hypothetical protein